MSKHSHKRGEAFAFLTSVIEDYKESDYESRLKDDCIEWPYKRYHTNYGYVRLPKSVLDTGCGNPNRSITVTRHFLSKVEREPLPGEQAAHGPCRNRACIIHVRWLTQKENEADKLRDGVDPRGERCGAAKLTTEQVLEMRKLFETGKYTKTKLGEMFNISRRQASDIINRVCWFHI